MNPEFIHNLVVYLLKFISLIPGINSLLKYFLNVNHPVLERDLFGIRFPNPIGLAAGFDKDAEIYESISSLGFGFIEIGTVTPEPQPGNDKPRLFRLKKNKALINRMGFNNKGVKHTKSKLLNKPANIIVGANIGKNKWTSNENAFEDYLVCFNTLYTHVDYFVVNVSSPNTPDLRSLQEKEPLKNLLMKLNQAKNKMAEHKPILLKIAPDLSYEQLDDIIEIVIETKIDGIIATNTTIARDGLSYSPEFVNEIGNGGLSGKPLQYKSNEVIRYICEKSMNKIPVIGVGGIMDVNDVVEKIKAGASLVQLYTGFIYEGPAVVRKINKELIKFFESGQKER